MVTALMLRRINRRKISGLRAIALATVVSVAGCGASAETTEQDAGSGSTLVESGTDAPTNGSSTVEAATSEAASGSTPIEAASDTLSEVVSTVTQDAEAGGETIADDGGVDATDSPTAMPDSGSMAIDAAGSCTDKKKNGDETDVDCGGSCAGCGPNKACMVDSDCSATASGCDANHGGCTCDSASKRCVYNHCFDRKKSGGESDVDCGGGVCPPCGRGLACERDADCSSNGCDSVTLTCALDPCFDHHQDGSESDVDCGGFLGLCARCRVGKRCNLNADCQSGFYCAGDGPGVCTSR
jgi:hypothetical protein